MRLISKFADIVSVDDYEERERSPSPVGTSGTRRSTRQRRQPGSSLANSKKPQRRKPELITVKKLDTLKNIRIKIQELTDTPTLYQRIFFNNREIEDSSETVESIGITQGESLQVLLLDVPNEDEVDIGLFENSAPVSSRPRATSKDKPKSNGRPEGFVGTALSGLDARSDEARAAREREEAEILAAIPGRCRVCTYQNEAGVKRCEMCENDI